MLTVQEVAKKLKVHPVTVYKWCYSGELASLKFVGTRRIEEEALEKFIRQRNGKKHGDKE